MNIEELITRFEHYATVLKEIKHDPSKRNTRAFLHLDIQDLQESLTSGLKFPAVLLQTPEISKNGDNYDNINEELIFTFLVIHASRNKGKTQLIAESKKITDKIFNRLATDIKGDADYGVLTGTDEGEFGPMGELYGWGVSCSIISPYDAEIDPTDWTDLGEEVK